MRSDAPPLLPIFRSRHQADLLTTLYLHPDREYTLTELATQLGVPASTLHREVHRLLDSELLVGREVGSARLLRANAESRLAAPLTHLLTIAFGPQTVVEQEFAAVPDVELILIFGSWAARYRGRPGAPPQDVDVLVVGRPNRSDLYDAADRAAQRLGYPVNPTVRSMKAWLESADALIQQIRSSDTVPVVDRTGVPKRATP
jgi:hypothetical protein